MRRSFERDIIPMARDEGMALAPWDVLATGRIRSDEQDKAYKESKEKGRTGWSAEGTERREQDIAMCNALEKVREEVGAGTIQAGENLSSSALLGHNSNLEPVAIAYLLQKTPYVFPVIGGRKVENLYKNMEAIELVLSAEQITYLESIVPFDPGFPMWMIVSANIRRDVFVLIRWGIGRWYR